MENRVFQANVVIYYITMKPYTKLNSLHRTIFWFVDLSLNFVILLYWIDHFNEKRFILEGFICKF